MSYWNIVSIHWDIYDKEVAAEMYFQQMERELQEEDMLYEDEWLERERQAFQNASREILYFSEPLDFAEDEDVLKNILLTFSLWEKAIKMELWRERWQIEHTLRQSVNTNKTL